IGAMDVSDGISQSRITLHYSVGDFDGLVGRVIEHLNVELVFGIVEATDCIDQPIDNELFVKNGKLNGNAGQFGEFLRWLSRPIPTVPVIHVNEDVAIQSVTGEDDQHDKVRNQQGEIEGIRTVEPLESLIEIMRLEVVPPVLCGNQEDKNCG